MAYIVEIQTEPRAAYSPLRNWDAVHHERRDAEQSAERARLLWHDARVVYIDAPAHVDHLYHNVADPADQSYLYA